MRRRADHRGLRARGARGSIEVAGAPDAGARAGGVAALRAREAGARLGGLAAREGAAARGCAAARRGLDAPGGRGHGPGTRGGAGPRIGEGPGVGRDAGLGCARGRDAGVLQRGRGGAVRPAAGALRAVALGAAAGGVGRAIRMRVRRDAVHGGAVVHDVRVDVVVEDVRGRAEDVSRGGDHPECDGDAGGPVKSRRHGGPADVPIIAGAPDDPRGRIDAAGDPRPSVRGDPDPAAVMEGDVPPLVIADPEPLAVVGHGPVARRDVRGEVGADSVGGGDPDGAVGGVFDPGAVGGEGGPELGEGAGVGVRVLVLRVGGHVPLVDLVLGGLCLWRL